MKNSSFLIAASLLLAAQHAFAQQPASAGLAPTTESRAPVLSASARQEAAENIAAAAERSYVDPSSGAELARHIRQRLRSGAYDGHADPASFAAALTSDLRSIVPDLHLRVAYEPDRNASTGPAQASASVGSGRMMARIDPRGASEIARTNFGFDRVERLEGNVGYLKLSKLVPPDLSRATAEAAMGFLANSDAVIIDVRGVPGGSPELVRLLLGHFVREPLRLLTTFDRPSGTTEEIWTPQGPAGGWLVFRFMCFRTAPPHRLQRCSLTSCSVETSARSWVRPAGVRETAGT